MNANFRALQGAALRLEAQTIDGGAGQVPPHDGVETRLKVAIEKYEAFESLNPDKGKDDLQARALTGLKAAVERHFGANDTPQKRGQLSRAAAASQLAEIDELVKQVPEKKGYVQVSLQVAFAKYWDKVDDHLVVTAGKPGNSLDEMRRALAVADAEAFVNTLSGFENYRAEATKEKASAEEQSQRLTLTDASAKRVIDGVRSFAEQGDLKPDELKQIINDALAAVTPLANVNDNIKPYVAAVHAAINAVNQAAQKI